MKKQIKFEISKKPGPLGMSVEDQPLLVRSATSGWVANKEIEFTDQVINVFLKMRGQKGMVYEMKMILNAVAKDIKIELETNGVSTKELEFPLSSFNL